MTDQTLTPLVAAAERGDLDAYAAALAAIPVQRLNTIGKEVAFQRSVAQLACIVRAADSADDRLRALALIGRADNTTQQKQAPIADAALSAVRVSPPPLAAGDRILTPDDRYYISLVIARAKESWVAPFAARALVDEGGETRLKYDVRAAYAALIFDRSNTLADAYLAIEQAISGSRHDDPGTKGVELSRTRRLIKLLPAIETATRQSLHESGTELLSTFNALMQRLVFRHGRPTAGVDSDDVTADAAGAALMLLSTLLRTRFVLSVEPEAYVSVGRLKYWLKLDSWPKSTAPARQRLSQILLQAITLRAKTGNPSRELLKVLIQLAGDRRRVEPAIATIADQPGVAPEIQEWLRAAGQRTAPKFQTRASEEAGLRDVDTLLATAAIRAARVQELTEGGGKAALARVRTHPDLAEDARTLLQTATSSRALAADTLTLLRRRRMALFGAPGETVPADRKRHRTDDGRLIDTAMVQIDRQGVERVLPDGVADVIVPAVVTPVEGKRK